MTAKSLINIVLAAGEGTRMRSSIPKVMHEIAGRPLIGHIIGSVQDFAQSEIGVVVGPDHQKTVDYLEGLELEGLRTYVQTDRLGTAHAVDSARALWDHEDHHVLVLIGDAPLIRIDTLKAIVAQLDKGADMVVVGFEAKDPAGYGRMKMEADQLTYIREHKDASDEELAITLCNAGVMGFNSSVMADLIDAIDNNNAQEEYYLTDAVEAANELGKSVRVVIADETEVMGINNRMQLSEAEHIFQERAREYFMMQGVTLKDPRSVYFSYDTEIGSDVLIEPHVYFGPGVSVGDRARVYGFSHLEGSAIGEGAQIGPFARLRPGSELAEETKVGNFCELKQAKIGKGAKINHLSYIGDADIGANANIGAGTITCNYDGFSKFKTTIGEGVFVGSNSALVAPVTLGHQSYIASGSVITEDVEQDDLAFGRARQVIKKGRAKEIREKGKSK